MKRFLLFIALCHFALLWTGPSRAATAPPLLVQEKVDNVSEEPKAVPAKSTPSPASESMTVEVPSSTPSTQSIWVGPGVAVYSGNYGSILAKNNVALTMNLSWMTLASPKLPLFVGIDGALHFWNSQIGAQSISGTGIQLLPSALYRFTLGSAASIHPFFGISFGPHFYVGQSAIHGNTQAVFLEFLVRPGVQWELNPAFALNFEPKVGVLNSDFILIPQLTATMAL